MTRLECDLQYLTKMQRSLKPAIVNVNVDTRKSKTARRQKPLRQWISTFVSQRNLLNGLKAITNLFWFWLKLILYLKLQPSVSSLGKNITKRSEPSLFYFKANVSINILKRNTQN